MARFVGILSAAIVGLAAFSGMAQEKSPIRTVKGGILDEVKLYVDKLPATSHVAIKPFSASVEDLKEGDNKKDETKKMQTEAPPLLAETFVAKLKAAGPFTEVSAVTAAGTPPAEGLVVDGKFVELDPGSRAKRYFVGFGAGKSGVTVEGSVRSGDGTLLATFRQRRVGVMGMAGGDSMGKLRADTKDIAEDIAKFLSAWAKGNSLK